MVIYKLEYSRKKQMAEYMGPKLTVLGGTQPLIHNTKISEWCVPSLQICWRRMLGIGQLADLVQSLAYDNQCRTAKYHLAC
jgi:hypothetical protein